MDETPPQMLYSVHFGLPVAVLPRTRDGVRRVADGRRWLSVDQAARFFGRTPEEMADVWVQTWADCTAAEGESLPSQPAPSLPRRFWRPRGTR